jgi:lysophospholipase L1-like esterase
VRHSIERLGPVCSALLCSALAGGLGCSTDGAQDWGADAAAAYDAKASDAAGGSPGDTTARPDTEGSPPQIDAAMGDGALPVDAADGDDGKTGGGEAGEEPDAGPPAIRYIGRFDTSHPDAPQGEWSASAMEARFSGTEVSAKLGGTGNYFEVVLDGVVKPVIQTTGASGYPIATGLAAGTHDVLVFRRDEATDNATTFSGFDFGPGGQLLSPPPAPSRRIELVGDSISCAFGDECAKASDGFTPATENEYVGYGPLTARALGAEIHVVAWSGKGLYRNLGGDTTDTMPVLWQRTIPTDSTSRWTPSQWIPDVVVINLGTNDYNAQGPDPSANFQATYLQFVTTLKNVYPNVFVFGAVGPMLGGSRYGSVKTAITNVVSMLAAAGDERMALVEFPTQDCGTDGTGCGCAGHPNVDEHQKMATILEAAIRSALGW